MRVTTNAIAAILRFANCFAVSLADRFTLGVNLLHEVVAREHANGATPILFADHLRSLFREFAFENFDSLGERLERWLHHVIVSARLTKLYTNRPIDALMGL